MTVPNLKTIGGFRKHVVSELPQPSQYELKSSEVTTIDMHDCLISAQTLDSMLTRTNGLKNFHYTNDTCDSCQHREHLQQPALKPGDSNPQHFLDTLQQHAGDTLQTLESSFELDKCLKPIGSLHGFLSLKSVTLSASMLLQQDGTFPSLVDILPFAIEYLRIKRLRSLFRNQLQGLYMATIAFQEKADADLYHYTLGLDKCTVQIGPHTVSVKQVALSRSSH